MIKKIIACTLLLCLFIAIPLSMAGVTRVQLGTNFLAFLKNCNRDLESYKVQIPNIPSIPKLESPTGLLVVVQVLIQFVNGLASIVNILINIINVVISLIEFITLMIYNLIVFKDSLTQYVPNP